MDLSQPLTLTNVRCEKCGCSIAPHFFAGQESIYLVCGCGHGESFHRPRDVKEWGAVSESPPSQPDSYQNAVVTCKCGHNQIENVKIGTTWQCLQCQGLNLYLPADKEKADKIKERSASHIIRRAAELVSGSRAVQHGPKERNHQNIADHWNAYLGRRLDRPLSPLDVALMMAELKIARAKGSIQMGLEPNPDNFVDLAGYAGVAGEIALNGGEEEK